MRSSSLPLLASTATECLKGSEISETQTPLGTDVRETMEKASVVTSYETSLLETVVPPLTSEAVIVQVCDIPSPSDISVNAVNLVTESDAPMFQPAPSETFASHSHDDSRVQASEKIVPSLGSWAKPLFFQTSSHSLHLHLHTPPEPSTPRDYDHAIVGNQLAALWPMLNDEILKNQPKGNMGEAKVLAEMELDREFPKLIPLDDKQGNIFLVNVEYTWIPSMCERCGNLGHKAKMCLLPSTTSKVSASTSASKDTCSKVPVVDIDTILQQKDNVSSSPATIQQNEPHANPKLSLPTPYCGAPEPQKHIKEIEGLVYELEITPA
ncbi:unnamed protein product [Brassica rapa subsp. trilocularis]